MLRSQTVTSPTRAGVLAQIGLILLSPYLKSPHFQLFPFGISSFPPSFQLNANSSRLDLFSPLFYLGSSPEGRQIFGTSTRSHCGTQAQGAGGCHGPGGKVGGLEWEGQRRRIGCWSHPGGVQEMSRQEQGRAGGWRKAFTVAQMLTGLPPLVSGSSACSMA